MWLHFKFLVTRLENGTAVDSSKRMRLGPYRTPFKNDSAHCGSASAAESGQLSTQTYRTAVNPPRASVDSYEFTADIPPHTPSNSIPAGAGVRKAP